MGRSIDERVVQMRFENGQFERGVQASIKSMQQLKAGLDFEGSVKGFEELDKAANGLKLDAILNAITNIESKFGWMSRTVRRYMDQITDKAIQTGKTLVKSLSTDQITVGWSKFEDKTGAVQTIMAATAKQFSDTGEQMEFVNAQLDKLNWFTDETSYNFVDMVNNIGKFTSNNIDLATSVTAMQGIANWAAISGANANEASRAMYNLSQALATGTVKLQDWMSIENANMGTAAFKEMAIQAALTAGTLVKAGDKIVTANGKTEVSVEKFRDTLSEKWFTKDVLMATLDQYGRATDALNILYEATGQLTSDLVRDIDAYSEGTKTAAEISEEWGLDLEKTTAILEDFQSETMQFGLKAFKAAQEAKTFTDAINSVKDAVSTGWMKSFELMFGDYMQAKEFWTQIANTLYDIFAESGNARNDMLKEWNQKGGRLYLIDTIYAGLAAVLRVMDAVSAAWRDVFPEVTADTLLDLTKKVHDFVVALAANDDTFKKLSKTARGLFSVLNILRVLFTGAFSKMIKLFKALSGDMNFGFLDLTASIGDNLYALNKWVQEETFLNDALDKMIDHIANAVNSIKTFVTSIYNLEGTQTAISKVKEFFVAIFTDIKNIFADAKSGALDFSNVFSAVKDVINIRSLQDLVTWLDNIRKAFWELITEIGGRYFSETVSFFGSMFDWIAEKLGIINTPIQGVVDMIKYLSQSFKDFFGVVDAIDVMLFGVAIATVKAVKDISSAMKSMASAIKSIANPLGDFLTKLNKSIDKYVKSKATVNYAAAILVLAGAIFVLSKVDSARLWESVAVIGALAGGILAFSLAMKKIGGSDFKSEYFAALAGGILALAAALFVISKVENVWQSLFVLSLIVVEMAAVAVAVNKFAPSIQKGAGTLIGFSVAVYLIVGALKKLGNLDLDILKQGLPGLIAIMTTMAVAMRIMNGRIFRGDATTSAGSILAFAVSLHLVIAAMKSLNKMDPEDVLKGLMSVGALMIEIGVLFRLVRAVGGKSAAGAGAAVLAIAVSMNIIIPAVKALAKLDKKTMTAAMANLSMIGLVFVAAIAATNLTGKYAGRAGLMLLEMTAALAIIPIVVRGLGRMDTKDLIKGTLAVDAIGLMFAVVVAASKEAQKSAPSIVAMSAAIGLLAFVVFQLSKLDPESVLSSAIGMSALLLAMAGSFKLIGSATSGSWGDLTKSIGTVYLMLGAVDILALIIKQLGQIENPYGVIGAAVGMSALLLSISASLAIMTKFETKALEKGVLGNLYAMIPVIAALGLIVGVLAGVPGLSGGRAVVMTLAVSTLLIAMTASFAAVGALSKARMVPTKAVTQKFAVFAAIVAGLGLIVGLMSLVPNPGNALAMSQILALFTLEIAAVFSAFSFITSKVTIKKAAVQQFAIFSAVLVPIAAIIAIMSKFADPVPAIVSAAALAILLPSMAASIGILAKMKVKLDPGIAGQFAIFSVIAGALGAALVALAALAAYLGADIGTILTISGALSVIIPVLAGTVTLMAKFSAGVTPAVIGQIASLSASMIIVFAAVAGLIVGFAYLMNQFDGARAALEAAPTYCTLLGEAIGGLVGGIVGGLISGVGGGIMSLIPQFGQAMSDFATNIQPFFDMLSGLDDGIIEKASLLAGVVLALGAAEFVTSLSNIGSGVLDTLSGIFGKEKNPSESFAQLGEAVKAFAEAIGTDINAEQVRNAAEAASLLSEVEKNLPRKGGVLEQFFGSQDMGAFGERMGQLGEGLRKFADEVVDVDPAVVDSAAAAAQTLVELEKGVPAQGGKLQAFLGEHDIGEFGERLKKFGSALRIYALKVTGIDDKSVKASASAGKALAELESSIPLNGGKLQSFIGEKDMGDFGERLKLFGEGLTGYITETADVTEDDVKGSVAAASALVELEKSLDNTGGIGSLFFGDSSFKTFGKNLEDFGKSLATYADTVAPIDTMQINSVTRAVKGIFLLKNDGVANLQTDVNEMGKQVATWVVDGIVTGLKIQAKRAGDVMNDVCDAMQSAFEKRMMIIAGFSKVMHQNGKYIIEGLTRGLQDSASIKKLVAQSVVLAKTVNEAFQNEAEIASPSVVMKENGVWLVKGLAEGITSDTSAEEAMKQKAQNITNAFRSEIDRLAVYSEQADLVYQLWEVTEGRKLDNLGENATDAEKQAAEAARHNAEMQHMYNQLEWQAKNVETYRAAMDATAKEFGTESREYVEAQNTYNTALIEFYKQANAIEDAEKEFEKKIKEQDSARQAEIDAASSIEKQREYAKFLTDEANLKTKEMLEMTDEEFQEWARKSTGFIPKWMAEQEKTLSSSPVFDFSQMIDSATAEQQIEFALESAANTAKASGKKVGQSLNQGLSEGAGEDGGSKKAAFSWADGLTDGVKEKLPDIDLSGATAGLELLSSFKKVEDIESPSKEMYKNGVFWVQGLTNGIDASMPLAINSSTAVGKGTLDAIGNKEPEFNNIGRQTMIGFANGISNAGAIAIERARSIASQVASIMSTTLSIHSPSRVTEKIGAFVSLGLAKGISENAYEVSNASEDLANKTVSMLDYAKTAIADVLATDDDFSPTITPVINMTDLKKQAEEIPGILDRQNGISTRLANISAQTIARNRAEISGKEPKPAEEQVTNINYTQNNYSPKALNRREIYRQTQNQISQLKGAIRK